MKRIHVNMMSSADKVAGQGVGGAYLELMNLLKNRAQKELKITKTLREKNPDITHFHTIDPHFFAMANFKKITGRRIGYVHLIPDTLDGSLEMPKIAEKIVKKYLVKFYDKMDHLVVVNPDFKEELVKIGIAREKITYIPNFVAKDKWSPLPESEKSEFRKAKGWGKDDFVILGVGQVQKRKGIDDFVKLAEANPNLKFVWAGGFSFGKMTSGYEKYKAMIENPPKNLQFLGIVDRDEMRKLYASVDLFLLPSFAELFPMSILEAASCGAPVMLRDLDLYKNILEGKYLAGKDFDEMNKTLRNFAQNPKLQAEMRAKSAEISEYYSEDRLLKIWIDFYREQAEK